MRKFLSILLSMVLGFTCMLSLTSESSANSPSYSNNVEFQLQVLSDSHTNEQVPYKITSASTQKTGENKYVTDYTVSVPLSGLGIQPLSSITSEKDEDALTARLSVTYYFRNNNSEIKITNVSGSWRGSITPVETKDREVSVTDGNGAFLIGAKIHRWHPTSDTFSYNTGWDYVSYTPHSAGAMSGPRCYSEVYYRIPSMGWDWHYLYFMIEIK